MAEGRMLKKKISKSRKLAALPSDSHRLFYTWLIPHLDIEGRIHADSDILKGEVVPRLKNWTPEKVEKTLLNLAENDLILLYTANGDRYLELKRFADEQSLRRDKEKVSEIPAPSEGDAFSGTPPVQLPPNDGTPPDEEKIREEKIREYVTLTPDQEKTLKDRFPEDRLEWMFDKLDFWATKKKRVISGYRYFKKGSWLLEEMEKHFNLSPKDSGLCEKCGKEPKYIGGLCSTCHFDKGDK